MEHPTDLELAVYRTLCWFSVFSHPLTRFELWKWLLKPERPYDLSEVDSVLTQSSWLFERFSTSDGFYTLKQETPYSLVSQRRKQFLDGMRKYRKLRRACSFFKCLPGVRAIAAVNSLAWWTTTSESDIDLFIVTQSKKIWSSRFFLVLPFLFFGNRPSQQIKTPVSDPFCFSFFVTKNALQLEALKWNEDDYYLAYWVKSMVPLFDREEVFGELVSLNRWATHFLPNAQPRVTHPLHRSCRVFLFPFQWSFLEPLFRFFQLNRLPSSLRALANKDSRVVVTDDMLKFHENDRRASFLRQFQETYAMHL